MIALLLVCVLLLAGSQAAPPEQVGGDAPARQTADRLRALQREADALAARERTLLGELRQLELERQISLTELSRITEELESTRRALEEAETRAAALARLADAQLPDVEARLVQLYKAGRAGYWRLLLNASDLQALARAYRAAVTLNAIDRARITEHYATLDALAAERKTLQARAGELTALQAAAAKTKARLDEAVASRNQLVKSIDERRDLNAQLTGELEAAEQRLQASISKLDAGRTAGSTLPMRPFRGELPWPVRGPVARRFGRSAGAGAAAVRNGLDISVPEGQPVRSVHEGSVAYADHFAGYGNLVILDHGGRSYSLYGYLGDIQVERGQRIGAGSVLGLSGRDPSGTPAVYFELRIDGAAVDPLQWLSQ